MAWHKTAVTPLLMHWSYCSHVLSHRYYLPKWLNKTVTWNPSLRKTRTPSCFLTSTTHPITTKLDSYILLLMHINIKFWRMLLVTYFGWFFFFFFNFRYVFFKVKHSIPYILRSSEFWLTWKEKKVPQSDTGSTIWPQSFTSPMTLTLYFLMSYFE